MADATFEKIPIDQRDNFHCIYSVLYAQSFD